MSETAAGILFVVATPIGNLEDISLRAVRVLREADLIAAEDTRHTAKLLHHYDIRRPTASLHEHNEQEKVPVARRQAPRRRPDRAGHRRRHAGRVGPRLPARPGRHRRRHPRGSHSRPQRRAGRARVLRPPDRQLRVRGIPAAEVRRAAGLVRSARRTNAARWCSSKPLTASGRRSKRPSTSLGDREVALGRELTKLHEEVVRGPLSAVLAPARRAAEANSRSFSPAGRNHRRHQANKLMIINCLQSLVV